MIINNYCREKIRNSSIYPLLVGARKFTRISAMHLRRIVRKTDYKFRCNICGTSCYAKKSELKRETPSCPGCQSSVRLRSMMHCLSLGLFEKSIPIWEIKSQKNIKGIGMSDWDGYAQRLAEKFNFINSYYHKEPFLDITQSPSESQTGAFDFVISSDVLEHVSQPIHVAFENILKLLKPGGVLALSVPYLKGVPTFEHFPDLYQFEVVQVQNDYILKNVRTDGSSSEYGNLIFHGGPGTTIEMRLFGLENLLENLRNAGFVDIKIIDAQVESYGIVWNPHDPSLDSYDYKILGLDAPPILARRPLA